MKKNDIRYMAVLGILIVLITGVLFTLLQSKQLVYGSITDWLSQHVAFAEYFRENFYQTGQLYPDFSLQLGAGQNMAEFIYYGLLRPEILLSYAFPMIKMSTYIMISSIALTITSTELFYYWIRKQNISQHAAFFASVIFLCAGPMLFHTHKHVMFINYMPWLILTFIGIQRYLQKRKSALMMIGIVLMILESYFYSVSALFMCGIYAIYEILRMQKKIDYLESLKTIGRLMGQVLIGVGISCFILLPTVIMMFSHTTYGVVEAGHGYQRTHLYRIQIQCVFCGYVGDCLGCGCIFYFQKFQRKTSSGYHDSTDYYPTLVLLYFKWSAVCTGKVFDSAHWLYDCGNAV